MTVLSLQYAAFGLFVLALIATTRADTEQSTEQAQR